MSAQSGDWNSLRPPLRIDDQREYLRQQQMAPPRGLCVRTALPAFHLLNVAEVIRIGFDPAQQSLHALVLDPAGHRWLVRRDHSAATPGALDAIAECLQQAQMHRQSLLVAGTVERCGEGLVIEPWSLGGAGVGVIIPDLYAPSGAVAAVPIAALAGTVADPLSAFLDQLDNMLCNLWRDGFLRSSDLHAQLDTLRVRADELGLGELTENNPAMAKSLFALLGELQSGLAAVRAGDNAQMGSTIDALLALARWTALAQHALPGVDLDRL